MSPGLELFLDCYAPLILGANFLIQGLIFYYKRKKSEEVRQRLSAKLVYFVLFNGLLQIAYGLYHLPRFNH